MQMRTQVVLIQRWFEMKPFYNYIHHSCYYFFYNKRIIVTKFSIFLYFTGSKFGTPL